MKIYKHEFTIMKYGIVTTEIEVEEKPKIYNVVKGQRCWESRILKEDINKLQGSYTRKMFTLSPDQTPFIEVLKKATEKRLESLKNEIDELVEERTYFANMLQEAESGEVEE